jgi:purine-nucleoside/S-methyl-5'-thioadenosine phosphorylase / adenosine deaminase
MRNTVIKSGALSNLTNISHGFFTRHGGTSTGIYAGRNCGLGSDDLRAHVIENRGRTADDLNVPRDQLLTLHQIHSATVITATEPWTPNDAPQGDAIVTATPGIGLGILTADCTPVLFADPANGVIGAAHAGWKGAVSGVLEETVDAMVQLGAKRDQIIACIGPTISQTNYEVGPEFKKQFVDQAAEHTAYFIPSAREGHFQFNLPGFVADQLGGLGLGEIEDSNLCTYADPDRFFSFRRTTHAGEPDYGRQISAIALE